MKKKSPNKFNISKQSPIKTASQRPDPKQLDKETHNLLANAKENIKEINAENTALKNEIANLDSAIEIMNNQKMELKQREEGLQAKVTQFKLENGELNTQKIQMIQSLTKAKDQLQSLVKLYNQSIKSYSLKIGQIKDKGNQIKTKSLERRAQLEHQIQIKTKENKDKERKIEENNIKIDTLKAVIDRSRDNEKVRMESLSKEVQDLESYLSNSQY